MEGYWSSKEKGALLLVPYSEISWLFSLRPSIWGDLSLGVLELTHAWMTSGWKLHGSQHAPLSSAHFPLDLPSRFMLHLELSIPQLEPAHFPWENSYTCSFTGLRNLNRTPPLRTPGHKIPPHLQQCLLTSPASSVFLSVATIDRQEALERCR